MAPRRESPANPRTRLALYRIRRGFTQGEMAERSGVKLGSYRRLERGELANPPVRWIVNCAIILDVSWQDLWEPAWNEWLDLGRSAPTEREIEGWRQIAHDWPEPSDKLIDKRPPFPDAL